ncbi:MAG: choice-of-anchor D domain-containing protein [bacterium]|nr:choice-of-anchor D domain-containing protein [bacterium]
MPSKRTRPPIGDTSPERNLLDLPLGGGAPDPAPLEPMIRGPAESEPPPASRGPRRRRGGWLWLVLALAFPLGALVGYFLHSGPPIAVLSTDLLDFGDVRRGAAGRELTLRVSNQGESDLRINAVVVSSETPNPGEAAEDFRVVADGCATGEVAPQAECEVRLAFAPSALGVRRAQIRLAGNALGSPSTVPLYGVGVAPELAIEPRTLDFRRQTVGTSSQPVSLRLDNRGTAPVRLGRLEIVGATGDFRLVADGCSAKSLAPGDRCSARYVFAPKEAGQRDASVRIESDATADPVTASLSGFAVARRPVLRLDTDRLDFGRLPVGRTSSARGVTLANDGNGPLRLRGLRLEQPGDVAAGGAFELSVPSCARGELSPGAECEVEVRFLPAAEGDARSALLLDSSATKEPYRLALTGIGTAAHAAIEPPRLSFGEVGLGNSGSIRELRVSSSGSADLAIEKVEMVGADAGSFSASGCAGQRLVPGADCVVQVRFQPQRAGPHRTDLRIRHSADGGRHQVPLNGLGVTARLSVDQSQLAFGEVETGSAARRRLTVSNAGRADLTVTRLRLTGGGDSGFWLDVDRCTGTTLRPAASCQIVVVFEPDAAGARSVRLAIEHSAARRPREVPVSATGIAPPVPEIRFEPGGLGFPDRRVGERGVIQTLRIHNLGTGRLILGEIRLEGEHPRDFEVVAGTCDGAPFVAPGSSCTVGLRFTPTAGGDRKGLIVVRHNAAGRTSRLELAGWGTSPPP